MEDNSTPFFQRIQLAFQPFSRAALFRVLFLALPLAALTITFKCIKLSKLGASVTLDKSFILLRWDLFFLFFYAFVFIVWLDRTQGWLRKLGLILLHVSVFFLMIIGAIEHSFFYDHRNDWGLVPFQIHSLAPEYVVGAAPQPISSTECRTSDTPHLAQYFAYFAREN